MRLKNYTKKEARNRKYYSNNIKQLFIEFNQCLQNYDKDKTVNLDFLLQTIKELTEKYFPKIKQSRKQYK